MFEVISAIEAEVILVAAVVPLLIHDPRRRGRIARYGTIRNPQLIEEDTMLDSLLNWWERRRADRKRRRDVGMNRARHPDLVEREDWYGEDAITIAESMRSRDRLDLYQEGIGDDDLRYPVLADYIYEEPPSRWGRRHWFEGFGQFCRLFATGSLELE